MTCFTFRAGMGPAGPCAKCGVWTDRAHVVDVAIYCGECCGWCNPQHPEWSSEVGAVEGEQKGFDW